MENLKLKVSSIFIMGWLLVFPIFAQKSNDKKPSIAIQTFEVQKGVEISHSNIDLIMENLYDQLKKTKKFSEIKMVELPPPSQNQKVTTNNSESTNSTNNALETDYLMTGIITKHTSPGAFTKITTAGVVNKTVVYITFTIVDKRIGKIVVKRNVDGEIARSFLFNSALPAVYRIVEITKKGL